MIPTQDDLDNWFVYHPPNPGQTARYEVLRRAARGFAGVIWALCPEGADRSAAIRKVREAVMTAIAAIACGEEP